MTELRDDDKKRVLILGAGFAGLYTALHLEKKLAENSPAEITLVDMNHYHLFTPMLHEAAAGLIHTSVILSPIRRILRGKRITFKRARVEGIDVEARQVSTCCEVLSYDILVIGLGSVTNFYGLDSVRQRALELKSADDADRLRCHVINRFEAATREPDRRRRRKLLSFVVVGGGCTGVETVAELHEFLEHLLEEQYAQLDPDELRTVLVEALDCLLPQMDSRLSRKSRERLQSMGIEVRLNTRVTDFNDEGLVFAGDEGTLPTDTLVWAAGVRAHPLVEALPLDKDHMGRVVVDSSLCVPDKPDVYVMGDAAHAHHPETDEVYPPTAQVAYRQAEVAAANVAADLLGGEHEPFDFKYIGDLVSLGRLSGVADPYGLRLWGVPAWLMWKFYYLLSLVGWQNRLRVALNWFLALIFPTDSTLPHQCTPECDRDFCL